MDAETKKEILKKAEGFFEKVIIPSHLRNVKKLNELSEFTYNPFLLNYLANFYTGSDKPQDIARILILPRILGTSITTSFGQHAQSFCRNILSGLGSAISGVDIEFIDQVDSRKKYCQLKAGPQTINHDDVTTIKNHFLAAKRIAKQNGLNIGIEDMIVGVLYGDDKQLNPFYRSLRDEYPVFVGKEFWYRLTGDKSFYLDLIDRLGEVAKKTNSKQMIESVVKDLSSDIKKKVKQGKL
jgi:hypothetical protein